MIRRRKESRSIENVSRRIFCRECSRPAHLCCARANPRFSQQRPEMGHPTAPGAAPASRDAPRFILACFVGIQTDGTVVIVAHRTEMGNGVRTSLPRILADELDADWSRVKVIQGDGDERYGSQDTDGSHSVREFFDPLREAGATARLMLVRAAAQQWGVPEIQCVADPPHVVSHKASSRKLGYGELAALAAKQPVPKKEELKLKSRAGVALHRQAGARVRRGRMSARASRCLAWMCAWTACCMRRLRIRRCWAGK